MSRPLRLAGYIGLGIAGGLLLATLAIFILTRTDWGMERARRFAIAWLDDRITGELRLSRVTGPGLLRGVIVHDFEIIDERGRRFVHADSVELAYNLRTLLAGSIVLNRVVLHQPEITIERLPGDTVWNFEHIFADTTPVPLEPRRSLIVINDGIVHNGTAIIRMPFEPEGPVAPADTARLLIEPAPGGLVRVLRFEDVAARLNRVIWESPVEPGQLFDVASLSARGYVWRDAFQVRDARGTLTRRDSVVAFDFPEVQLPGSQASVLGRFVARTGDNDIDVRVDARRLRFADVQWIYPALPDEGGGTLVLRIQSQPRGMLWLAEDARLQAPGTSIAGTVGVVTGDTLYFTRVDLRASPLDIRLIEDLLPGGLPVDGLLIGTVEVRGPLSALETRGDLQLAGGGVGSGSHVTWSGVLDARSRDIAARSLSADVRHLELALLTALDPDLRMDGSVSGRVEGSGRLDHMVFNASLVHAGRDGARSTLDGGGSFSRDGADRAVDLTIEAAPVSLRDLAAWAPVLESLEGDLRGPVRLVGTARDLRFDGNLATAAGPLALAGRIVRGAGAPRVSGTADVRAFALNALQPDLPPLFVSGRLGFDIAGDDVATAAGTVHLALDSVRLGDVPLGRVAVGGRMDDGVFALDSALLEGRVGLARARGSIALLETRRGALELGYISESITPLEPYLMGESDADLEPRLAGRVDATATVSGWLGSLDVNAAGQADGFVYGSSRAERLRVDMTATGLRGDAPAPLRLLAIADSVELWSHPVQTARFEAAGYADSLALSAGADVARQERLAFRGDLLRDAEDGTTLNATALRVGAAQPWRLAAPTTVRFEDGRIRLAGVELRRDAGGTIHAAGRLAWVADADGNLPLDFQVALSAAPFTEVLGALRSTTEGAGEVDATLRVYGSALDPLIEGEVHGRDLRYGDVRIDRAFAELSYSALGLDAHAETQYAGRSILTGGGRVPIDLRMTPVAERRLDEPLRFTIMADSLPLALPLAMLDGFSAVQGGLSGRVAFSGTTLNPALSGGFILAGGGADWDVTGLRYRDVGGTFTLERDRILRVAMDARAVDPRVRAVVRPPGGTGTITGTLDLVDLTDPGFDLRFNADRVFAARRRDVEATVTGVLTLEGRYTRPEIGGGVRVDQGALYLDEIYRQYLVVGFDDLSAVDTSLVAMTPVLGNVIASARNPFLRNMWVRDLQVRVGSDSWLRSRDMDVEVTGDLAIVFDRRDEDLRLIGSLNVERGTYTLYYPPFQSRRFNVRQGSIEFPGTPGIDPNLTISAAYRARARGEPLDVLAVVSGTLQNPRVRLTSESQPNISESDLASFLFFGVPSWEVASAGAGTADVRAVAGLGVRALTPSVLGYASSGLQTLVQSVGLFDYAALTAAEVATEPSGRTFSSLFGATQLELGTYLGSSNLFLGYSQPLGGGAYDPAVRLEWRFLPHYTLEMFAEDRFARAPGFGLRSAAEFKKKVYGFNLFREWGF